MTQGKFGFHRGGGKHEPGPAAAYVQIYVKSSALSRTPDLAISAHLDDIGSFPVPPTFTARRGAMYFVINRPVLDERVSLYLISSKAYS